LLRASFRPKGEIVELRAYLRQRERLLEYAASHIQHMQKALTEMNLQLHHVVADITGATGLRIIRAILAGERDPAALARLRDTRCHASVETITKALTGQGITVPSTYSGSSKRSLFMMRTRRRHRPVTPGLRSS
jgi:transposase